MSTSKFVAKPPQLLSDAQIAFPLGVTGEMRTLERGEHAGELDLNLQFQWVEGTSKKFQLSAPSLAELEESSEFLRMDGLKDDGTGPWRCEQSTKSYWLVKAASCPQIVALYRWQVEQLAAIKLMCESNFPLDPTLPQWVPKPFLRKLDEAGEYYELKMSIKPCAEVRVVGQSTPVPAWCMQPGDRQVSLVFRLAVWNMAPYAIENPEQPPCYGVSAICLSAPTAPVSRPGAEKPPADKRGAIAQGFAPTDLESLGSAAVEEPSSKRRKFEAAGVVGAGITF